MKKLLLNLLGFLAIACSAQADETKKYTLSVCALFKNESPFLKEWIEYHRLIGVEHFYLYNNGSLDAFRKVLSPYVRSRVVTLIQWGDWLGPIANDDIIWALSTQIPAYENAAKWEAIDDTKWLVFLDVDEFLVPCSKNKIIDILHQYDEYPGVILASEYYDASTRGVLPPRKLVVETTEMTAPPEPELRRSVEKTIFKPELCTSVTWPPYRCNFQNGCKAVKIDKEAIRINRYENRMRFQKIDKVKRKLQVDEENLSEKEKGDLLKSGYEIEDSEKIIYRFIPDLYKIMGISVEKK